jgi:hypothetical protein
MSALLVVVVTGTNVRNWMIKVSVSFKEMETSIMNAAF